MTGGFSKQPARWKLHMVQKKKSTVYQWKFDIHKFDMNLKQAAFAWDFMISHWPGILNHTLPSAGHEDTYSLIMLDRLHKWMLLKSNVVTNVNYEVLM